MLPKIYRINDLDIRRHQVNTLKIFNDNVVEIREGYEYKITFKSGRNELTLHISLTSDFPKEKPVLKINPAVAHTWVNREGEVASAPGLLNFTIHSDLGRVVQAITREFERNPPPLLNDCTPGSNITSPTIAMRDSERSSPSYGAMSSFSPPSTHSLSSNLYKNHQKWVFPELSKLNMEELEFLNSNVDRQQEFLNELPSIREQNKTLDELIVQVEDLAESNLSKQEELEELKATIDERLEEVAKLAFENERLHVQYQEFSEKYSPINIKEKLSLAAAQAEIECEQLAEAFLNRDMDVEKFVSNYTKTRTLCHTRKTKEEQLSHQLQSLEKAGF